QPTPGSSPGGGSRVVAPGSVPWSSDAGQPITLVAVASSLGGFSKVWNGAGDGTSHSRPSAPSHGFCGAGSPLPRIIGTTTNRKKYTCIRPKPKAPIDASMLKSANCIG